MNLIHTAAPLTMTSREIADLVGKEHKHVMRDIRVMLGELNVDIEGYAQNWTDPQNGQSYPMFQLPKRETLVLVSGYSVQMRAAIIDRWQQLESVALPRSFAEALRLAAAQQDEIERQQAQIEAAKPAVEFVQRYVHADGLKGFREVCKLLKANEARFRAFVIDAKIMYRLGGALTAHQNHIDAGRFQVRTGVAEVSDHAYTTTKFTPKGVDWIAGEWAKHQLKQVENA